jgi:hypothetical protein
LKLLTFNSTFYQVKKAGEIAMTNEFIAGELFDHMMHLRSLFGVRQVFGGILTSNDEWRVCWLPDDESKKLAAADSLSEAVCVLMFFFSKANGDDM